MNMEKFQPLDISGDAGIRVFGNTPEEIFANASAGLYSLITDISLVKAEKTAEISASGNSPESLLISWLNELIFQFDTYGFIAKEVMTLEIFPEIRVPDAHEAKPGGNDYRVRAVLSGEDFDPERHEGRLLVKAATYHKLRIEKAGSEWQADIIFDT